MGTRLIKKLESIAREQGIDALYLLTTTAGDFFLKRGYGVVDRTVVPAGIQATEEFVSICPSNAVPMMKRI